MKSTILVLALSLAAHDGQATIAMYSEEGCARQLDTLGVYLDASRRQFVITVASDDASPAWANSLCPRSVTIERLNIRRETVKSVQDVVAGRSFHPDAAEYTYITWLDLKTAKMIVVTDAPNNVLEPLRRQFGSVLVFRESRQALDINDVRDQRQYLRRYNGE